MNPRWWPVVVLCAAISACASSPSALIIETPTAGARPMAHIRGVASYDAAIATVEHLLREAFAFDAVHATIEFLPDAGPFAAALERSGYEPAFARETAGRMRAVALRRRVLINREAMSESSWTARVGTLAHELVHCLQYEWAGGRRGTSEQWLREGMAEWVALQTLERLGAFEAGATRRWLGEQMVSSNRRDAPRLDDMMTFRQWVTLAARDDIVPHVQSVLAVDALVTSRGLDAVVGYFRLFAEREDPERNFLAAFQTSRADFQRTMERQLNLGPSGTTRD